MNQGGNRGLGNLERNQVAGSDRSGWGGKGASVSIPRICNTEIIEYREYVIPRTVVLHRTTLLTAHYSGIDHP